MIANTLAIFSKMAKYFIKWCCLLIFMFILVPVALTVPGPSIFNPHCVRHTYPPTERSTVPSMTVNLDLSPEERWKDVVRDKAEQIRNLLTTFKDFIRNFGDEGQELIDFVDKDMGRLTGTLPEPFASELRGIANATGLPLGEVVIYNIFYEVFTVCTSIIAEDPTGVLYHARNLDFGLFMGWNAKNESWEVTSALRPLIVNLDFQKGGKTVFKAVQYAGYVGIITGMKPGILTLSMNERFNVDGGFIGILEWILGIRTGVQWVNFLTRSVLENATSYAQAKDKLSNSKILAPAYYILGGNKTGEGCIITRSREKAIDVWDIGTRNSTWYLLETNYDHWKAPLFLDDRRTPGNICMKNLTQQNVGFPGIFDVLSSKPVLNKLTTYTALMQVNTGKLETYLQYCNDEDTCVPW